MVTRRVTQIGLLFGMTPDELDDFGRPDGVEEGDMNTLFSALSMELPGLPEHLRMLHVKVEWGDESAPDRVERTSVAFDHQAAVEALGDLGGAGTLAGGDDDRGARDAGSEEL